MPYIYVTLPPLYDTQNFNDAPGIYEIIYSIPVMLKRYGEIWNTLNGLNYFIII